EYFGAVRREERLVRGNHVFAGSKQIEHGLLGPTGAADDFDRGVDRGILKHFAQVGGKELWSDERVARFGEILDDDAAEDERSSGPRRQPLWLFEQQFRHAAADRAAAYQ